MFDWLNALCSSFQNPYSYQAMFAMDPLTQQMQACERQIIEQNARNPSVQAMHRAHLAQGGTMSLEQFAYEYAATGGFTPQGKALRAANERANQAREHAAWQGLRQAEDNPAAAQAENAAHYSANQQEFGTQLMGNSTWIDPTTARTYALPHTLQPNTYYFDHATQQQFFCDPQGRYHILQNGWWYEMGRQ